MKRALAVLIMTLTLATPAFAQNTTELTVAATVATADFECDCYTYDSNGVAFEVARYFQGGRVGVIGELSYANGTGNLSGFTPTNINQGMLTWLTGIRVRSPAFGRLTPSVRIAAGVSYLELDERRQGAGVFNSRLFTTSVAVGLDFEITPEISVRAQPEVIWFEGYDNQIRASFGGVFRW